MGHSESCPLLMLLAGQIHRLHQQFHPGKRQWWAWTKFRYNVYFRLRAIYMRQIYFSCGVIFGAYHHRTFRRIMFIHFVTTRIYNVTCTIVIWLRSCVSYLQSSGLSVTISFVRYLAMRVAIRRTWRCFVLHSLSWEFYSRMIRLSLSSLLFPAW